MSEPPSEKAQLPGKKISLRVVYFVECSRGWVHRAHPLVPEIEGIASRGLHDPGGWCGEAQSGVGEECGRSGRSKISVQAAFLPLGILRMRDEPFAPELNASIQQFVHWSTQQESAEVVATKISEPLYHYTNEGGLRGIVESQKIWFTNYLHLNDPSELRYGMTIADRLLREIGDAAGPGLVKMFCDKVDNIFQHGTFEHLFDFYIASLSRNRDDLVQWQAYAGNGRGFALGLAPHLFEVVDMPNPKPSEYVVMPVIYGEDTAAPRFRAAIEAAVAIVKDNLLYLLDTENRIPFLQELAIELIVRQLLKISLTTKHQAYSHEKEVRLFIVGSQNDLKPHVKTRIRGSEIVPYIEGDMPLRHKNGIAEIVVGPAAVVTAEDKVRSLLQSFGMEPDNRIVASAIPYRAL